ncbi:hypothetical protein [Salsipaludibacter albus]|uniref:hypothetical protein n=1 Tax=Salsipaludibacter albus TaxID=2849650 RepID=UPI001EE4CB3D|nr:hypothetical protein [Salsipaludibacter albus]MBY5163074.1 hypothetical protein [Salsipaludibacter albus]
MDHDVGNDAPATATQMVVGHADPPPGPGRVAGDDDGGPSRRGWPLVAGVVVVLVAAALVLARPSERPDVSVRDWRSDEWVTAPAAPSGPIAERWSHVLPTDRVLVGFAPVDGHLVVASRDRLRSPEDDRVVVESLADGDGTRTWRREVPDRDTVVMLSDGAETHLLANVVPFGDPEGRSAWAGSGVAMLDAATGEVQWTADLGRDAGVELQPDGDLVVQDASGVRMVDAGSGAIRLSWPALDIGDEDSADGRRAWREGGAWIVPTPDGVGDRRRRRDRGVRGARAEHLAGGGPRRGRRGRRLTAGRPAAARRRDRLACRAR